MIPDAKFQGLGKVDKEESRVHYFAAIEPNKFSPTLVVVAGIVLSLNYLVFKLELPVLDVDKLPITKICPL